MSGRVESTGGPVWDGQAPVVVSVRQGLGVMAGVATPSTSDVVWEGELGGECGGLVKADRIAVEVSWLVGPAGGGDGPGSAGGFSGGGGVGRNVVGAPFCHEPPVVLASSGACRRATLAAW